MLKFVFDSVGNIADRKCWLLTVSPLNSMLSTVFYLRFIAKPHISVSSFADLRTGFCWFDPQLGQYYF